MKVLVCGSRFWKNREVIRRELQKLPPGTIIVNGKADGADFISSEIAKELGFEVREYEANWYPDGGDKIDKTAGPKRNHKMLREEHTAEEPVDLVLAFSADFSRSKGTHHMMTIARAAGIRVEPFVR